MLVLKDRLGRSTWVGLRCHLSFFSNIQETIHTLTDIKQTNQPNKQTKTKTKQGDPRLPRAAAARPPGLWCRARPPWCTKCSSGNPQPPHRSQRHPCCCCRACAGARGRGGGWGWGCGGPGAAAVRVQQAAVRLCGGWGVCVCGWPGVGFWWMVKPPLPTDRRVDSPMSLPFPY